MIIHTIYIIPVNFPLSPQGQEVPTHTLLEYNPWSGKHRARVIILSKGPLIKHRYSGAWTIDDPYTRIYRYSLGILKITDKFSAVLRRLHLIDEATTLDVTPTLLYLSDLPVAEDIDGKILFEITDENSKPRDTLKTVPTYRTGDKKHYLKNKPEERQHILERLKSLGYVQ